MEEYNTSNTYMQSGVDRKGRRRRKGSATPHLLLI
jgi:hypothetical protein